LKVLVINGSPRKSRGATAGILSHFVEGMKEAKAHVDVIYSIGQIVVDVSIVGKIHPANASKMMI